MRFFRMLVLILAGALAVAATPARHAPAAAPHPAATGGWDARLQVTPIGSHVYGNPAAKVKVAEYISYTCPHCAHLEAQSTGPLWQKYIPSGNVSVEIRHLVRDPVDMTVAVLTNCGAPARFLGNHAMFLEQQSRWIQPIVSAKDPQRKRWETGPVPQRMKAIATDFGFYPMMQSRGYTRAQVDACLSDPATPKRLAAMTEAAAKLGIDATPGLLIDGDPLAGTYDWETLEPQIQVRL